MVGAGEIPVIGQAQLNMPSASMPERESSLSADARGALERSTLHRIPLEKAAGLLEHRIQHLECGSLHILLGFAFDDPAQPDLKSLKTSPNPDMGRLPLSQLLAPNTQRPPIRMR